VDVVALQNAYRSQLSADKSFLDRPILLTGAVSSSRDTQQGALIQLKADPDAILDPPVYCYFSSKDQASALGTRQFVNVLGICRGIKDGHVVMTDCETIKDVAQFRHVPKPLRDRYHALTPVKTFKRAEQHELDRRRPQFWEHEKQAVEIVGRYPGPGPGLNEPNPSIRIDDVVCRFRPEHAASLKQLGHSWPVRVRGTVVPWNPTPDGRDPAFVELLDCGLVYDTPPP